MKSLTRLFLCLIPLLLFFACRKHSINNCVGVEPVTAKAFVGEVVGDSAIATDTAFVGTILFEAKGNFQQVRWKVGEDTRTFNTQKFTLKFDNPISTINVNLFVNGDPALSCFPNDDGADTAVKPLTIVPRDSLAKTPLIGDYWGFIQGKPADTFTVRINFWYDPKYRPYLGPAPFYTISNFPKGYRDTTSSIGTRFPELSYGYLCDWGYRALYINEDYKEAQEVKGYAYLASKDSLIIDYSRADLTAPYSSAGYPRMKEKFIGLRKR